MSKPKRRNEERPAEEGEIVERRIITRRHKEKKKNPLPTLVAKYLEVGAEDPILDEYNYIITILKYKPNGSAVRIVDPEGTPFTSLHNLNQILLSLTKGRGGAFRLYIRTQHKDDAEDTGFIKLDPYEIASMNPAEEPIYTAVDDDGENLELKKLELFQKERLESDKRYHELVLKAIEAKGGGGSGTTVDSFLKLFEKARELVGTSAPKEGGDGFDSTMMQMLMPMLLKPGENGGGQNGQHPAEVRYTALVKQLLEHGIIDDKGRFLVKPEKKAVAKEKPQAPPPA